MKVLLSVFFCLTAPVFLLILLVGIRRKPLGWCGKGCECSEEEMLGCEASVV